MNELIKDITARELEQISSNITEGVGKIIEQSKGSIAVYLNSKVVLTYWNIGKYIAKEIDLVGEEKYGTKIVATVSQQLAEQKWAPSPECSRGHRPATRRPGKTCRMSLS